MENVNSGLPVMFEEAQNQLSRQFKGSATLRDHAKTIISVSSVVVAFFATFKIGENEAIKTNVYVSLSFFLIAVAYALLMVFAIIAAMPYALEAPINPRIKDYVEAYADKDERTILSNQVTLYLRAIEKNEKVINNQSLWLNFSSFLLAIVVFLIMASTTLSVFI